MDGMEKFLEFIPVVIVILYFLFSFIFKPEKNKTTGKNSTIDPTWDDYENPPENTHTRDYDRDLKSVSVAVNKNGPTQDYMPVSNVESFMEQTALRNEKATALDRLKSISEKAVHSSSARKGQKNDASIQIDRILKTKDELRTAFLMSELLLPPVSLRDRSVIEKT